MGIKRFFRWVSDTYATAVDIQQPMSKDDVAVAKHRKVLGTVGTHAWLPTCAHQNHLADILYIDFNSLIHEGLRTVGLIGSGPFPEAKVRS